MQSEELQVVNKLVAVVCSPYDCWELHFSWVHMTMMGLLAVLGVLLCVSLIGKFPFEGDSVSTMGVNDPMKKVGGGEAGQAEGGGQGEELGSVGNAWMQQMGADNVSSSSEVVLHNSPASWILLASPPLL